jgi:hypothetical protein
MSPSAPIKILMTSDAVGGVWTYSTGLASALAAAGMEVYLVTVGPPPQREKRAMLRGGRVHLIESNLALEWQDPGAEDLPNARRFSRISKTRYSPMSSISTAFARQLSTGLRRSLSSHIPA